MRKIIHWALVMVIGMLALAPLATAQSPSKIGALMATQGVAMENGTDLTKRAASIIAPHCNEAGVATVLGRLLDRA